MSNGEAGGSSLLSLKELRAGLTGAEKKMVRDAMGHIERRLIEAIPEMLAGVKATGSQSSMSPTIALTPTGKKKRDVKLKVTTRVRAEREGFEDNYHIDDAGQLALGMFEEPPADEDDQDGAAPGFDDDFVDGDALH